MHSFEQQQKNNVQNQPTIIQPKLEVGNKDDEHEKEANDVAGKVMKMSEGESIQRKMPDEDEGKVMKMDDEDEGKVMKVDDEDEGKVMKMDDEDEGKVMKMDDEEEGKVMKMGEGGGGGGMTAPANVESGIAQSKGSGQNLPTNVQKDLGGKMGADFSGVKVHTDNQAHEMNESINAKAFTHGQDIYFKQGNYNPESSKGKELLAHELVHTKQQGGALRRQTDKPTSYTVQTKDTLYSIAKRYGTTVEAIQSLNGLKSFDIKIGQVLKIPQPQSAVKTKTDNKNEAKMYVTDKIASVKVYDDNKFVMSPKLAGNDQNEYVVSAIPGDNASFRRIEVTTITGEKQTRIFAPDLFRGSDMGVGNDIYTIRIIAKPTLDNILKRDSPYPKVFDQTQKQKAIDKMQDAIAFNTTMHARFKLRLDYIENEMKFESTDLGKSIFEGILNTALAAVGAVFPVAGVIGVAFLSAYQAYDKYRDAADTNTQLYKFADLNLELDKQLAATDKKLTDIKDAIEKNYELMQMLATAPPFPKDLISEKVSNEYEIRVWKEVLKQKMSVKYYSTFSKDISSYQRTNLDNSKYYYEFKAGHKSNYLLFWELSREYGYDVTEYWLESDADDSTTRIANRLFGELKVPKKEVFKDWGLPMSMYIVYGSYSGYGF